MPNSCLVKLAIEFSYRTTMCWICRKSAGDQFANISAFLATQPGHSCLFEILDGANIVYHQKEATHSA